jgi:hypothetical protein
MYYQDIINNIVNNITNNCKYSNSAVSVKLSIKKAFTENSYWKNILTNQKSIPIYNWYTFSLINISMFIILFLSLIYLFSTIQSLFKVYEITHIQ